MIRLTFFLSFFIGLLPAICGPNSASAQPPRGPRGGIELPPAPHEVPPTLMGEVHVHVVMPIDSDSLCPANAACIFTRGGGVGAIVERRWPTGIALQLGYDLWFLDGNGVWEIGVMHFLRAGIRYLFRQSRLVHPFLGVGFGGLVLGESFRTESFGAGFQFEVGTEVEIATTLALSVALTGRMFTTSAFRTRNDEVERGRGFDVNGAITLQVGIAIFESQ